MCHHWKFAVLETPTEAVLSTLTAVFYLSVSLSRDFCHCHSIATRDRLNIGTGDRQHLSDYTKMN